MMERKVGIMQPYFLPYLGYWQLIKSCDYFVIYDDIQYTKKGWINRNRMLVNGQDQIFTIPVKNGSSTDTVIEREVSQEFDRQKFLTKITEAYRKAPYYNSVFPLIKSMVEFSDVNLFYFILNSIKRVMEYLEITTPLIISSTLSIPQDLKGQDMVLWISKELQATEYINPIGGVELYDKYIFSDQDIKLSFLKMDEIIYPQFENDFIPYLSILDVMMFNSVDAIQDYLERWKKI